MSQSQEALSAMVCGYGKANRDAAVMVMFKAYFDDSCSDENDKVLVLAGWYKAIKCGQISASRGKPLWSELRVLSISTCATRGGEFSRWKGEDREEKIRFLATVVETFRPWTIVAWVSRKEHDAIMKAIAPVMIHHAYFRALSKPLRIEFFGNLFSRAVTRQNQPGFRWDETAGLAERAMLLSATHSRCKKETRQ